MKLTLMLGLNKTIDLFAMTSSVCLYGQVLRREDGHVIRRALQFEVEGQWKKGRLGKRKRQCKEECMKVVLCLEDVLWSIIVYCCRQ